MIRRRKIAGTDPDTTLKVNCNEKLRGVGNKTVIKLPSGMVAIKGYLKYELVSTL